MLEVFNTLGPVFLIILAGVLLRKFNFFTDQTISDLKRLAYWVGLPCYLFIELSEGYEMTTEAVNMLEILVIASTAAIVLLYIVAKFMRFETWRIGTFVQLGFRGNIAYVGLPVVFFAFMGATNNHQAANYAQKLAALGLGAMVVFYNTLSVIFLLTSRHGLKKSAIPIVIRQIFSNPLLVSTFLGIAWSLTGTSVPQPLPRAFQLVGKLALPVALLCVGGSLITTPIKGNIIAPALSSIIKTFICPLIGFGIAIWLGADPIGARVAIILLAVPTSVGSFVLTSQLSGDTHMASAGVVLSTLLSLISLALAVALTS